MANHLKMPKKQQVLALLALGWSYRRIEAETGVRRETVSRYDSARPSNADKAFPGSPPNAAKVFAGSRRSTAAGYREAIREKLDAGLSVQLHIVWCGRSSLTKFFDMPPRRTRRRRRARRAAQGLAMAEPR